MSSETKNTYEGMFLFPQAITSNLQAAVDHLGEIFRRAEAEVISLAKWDERRLAYDIKGNKRGVYFLAYFKSDPERLVGLERDCNLSEQILRAMVLKAETIPQELIEAADGREQLNDEIKARGAEAAETEAASTSSSGASSSASSTSSSSATATATATEAPPAAAPSGE